MPRKKSNPVKRKPRTPRAKSPRKPAPHKRHSPKLKAPAPTPAAARSQVYHSRIERSNVRQSEQSKSARDVGSITNIADLKRRESCRKDPERFCLTYNPESFKMPFCQDHRDVIARVKEAFTTGALFALALPRGSGKTTLCRMLSLWAISYAYLRYLIIIGANASKAEDNLAAIKSYIRFLPLYGQDFPEIAVCFQKLGGIAQRASGQLSDGEPTLIEWGQDRIVLPTVAKPGNWPNRWPLRHDGVVPTAGCVVGASGLTADGLRGSLLTLSTGEEVRPDGALLDDVQTGESATSPTQNATRLQLISADILGMAGPGKTLSAVLTGTVIAPGDMMDEVLDRKKNPVWRGERRGVLKSMPKTMEAWDQYFEVYFECAQKEPPDYESANAYYCAHRAELDEGAEASWPERKLPHEISAVQHAMHWYARNRMAFWSEGMNRPIVRQDIGEQLKADAILDRVNGLARETIPLNANLITIGADCGKSLLWYVAVAWEMSTFTGSVIDYGSWPRQDRHYYSKADAKQTLALAYPGLDTEAAIQAGLTAMSAQLLGREWKNEAQTPLKASQMLVDSKYLPDTVCEWARRSPHAAVILPSQGRYVGAKSVRQWHQYEKRPGERLGLHWLIAPVAQSNRATRIAAVDVNFWKTQIAQKLSMPAANKGALSLWGRPGEDHVLFAHHCTAQFGTDVSAHGRTVREWQDRPDRKDQSDLWDCLVYATAAASIQGAILTGSQSPQVQQRRLSLEEMKNGSRRAG